jgi:hypothetical protein
LWEGDFLQKKSRALASLPPSLPPAGKPLEPPAGKPLSMFPSLAPLAFTLPDLTLYELDDCYDEVELLGFPLRDPFVLVDDDPAKYVPGRDLVLYAGGVVTVLGYHITHKRVRTVKGDTMSFGTFLDVNKDWIDTVHFPEVHARHPPGAGFYRITGKVMEEFGVYSIEVTEIEKAGIRGRATARRTGTATGGATPCC